VGLNLQAASNVVLAELSWTSAEQTQAIDRVHRTGQAEPVTAWRIIASQTIDAKIAELIDSKRDLAARPGRGRLSLGYGRVQFSWEALVALLEDALGGRQSGTDPRPAPRMDSSVYQQGWHRQLLLPRREVGGDSGPREGVVTPAATWPASVIRRIPAAARVPRPRRNGQQF
jgi:hypothetical protein